MMYIYLGDSYEKKFLPLDRFDSIGLCYDLINFFCILVCII